MTRVAIAQITSSTNKQENLALANQLITEAKGKSARLIAFPEFLMSYSPTNQTAEELCSLAENVDQAFVTSVRHAARESQIHVVATFYEPSRLPNRVYDTALWIDSAGNVAAVYRKLHLYDALGFKESDKFVAGDELTPPIKTEIGQCGLMICYDLRFPELSRLLTLMGTNVLIAPSGWVQGEMKIDHWQTMIKARALENGCYVIAPDQVGNIYIGHSMVVDPFGRILVEMDEREGLEVIDIDLTLVQEVRQKLPLLQNRREDAYRKSSP
jgi:deaminated glutathione amidase